MALTFKQFIKLTIKINFRKMQSVRFELIYLCDSTNNKYNKPLKFKINEIGL